MPCNCYLPIYILAAVTQAWIKQCIIIILSLWVQGLMYRKCMNINFLLKVMLSGQVNFPCVPALHDGCVTEAREICVLKPFIALGCL